MTTRYVSVFLPSLPTDKLERSSPGGPRAREGARIGIQPLVTVDKVRGAQRIAAVDAAALDAGIRRGMTLADARAMHPALRVADAAADAAILVRIVEWCRSFTPLAASDGADGVLLDVGGAAHLFGGEAVLLDKLREGLGRQGFDACAAVADTPEAAWALARFGTCRVAPAADDPAFVRIVADLPLAALRIEETVVRTLAQAGLKRVGDLLYRPRAPVTARFGPQVFARLDGLMGRAKTPMSPRFEAPAYLAERRFASGLARHEDIQSALLPLAHHLCALLSRAGEGARRLEASLFRVDGAVTRVAVGTSRPTRDPDTIMALFREKIAALGEDGLDTGYGFDLIRLGVGASEPLPSRQDALPEMAEPGPSGRNDDIAARNLAVLADRLGARLGSSRVGRLAERGSHVPERATAFVPTSESLPSSKDAEGHEAPCRPLKLFSRPEPIETVAAVPDGPPVRFRWRRVSHEIAAIEGPERIAPEWWKGGSDLTRDYFRAEDRDGRRYWLFREGLFNREVSNARWFLHGLFG